MAICFAFSDSLAMHILRRPNIGTFIRTASFLILFQTIYTTINSVFVGLDKTEFNTLIASIQASTKAGISIILVILGMGILGAIYGYVLSFIPAIILGASILYKLYKSLYTDDGVLEGFSESLKTLIRYGFPLYLSSLVLGLASQYQNILLTIFTSNMDIGNFKAAMNFTTLISIFSVPIITALLPAFSKLELDPEKAKKFFQLSLKYTSILILPVAILISIYSEEIIKTIYGESYAEASFLLSLITIQYLWVGLGNLVLPSFFNGLGETKINFKITIINSAILIVSAPLLTWLFRTHGLISAILISSFISSLYSLYIAKTKFEIRLEPRNIARIYLVSFIPIIPIIIFKNILPLTGLIQLILGCLTYSISYAFLIPLTKTITMNELNDIKLAFYHTRLLRTLTKPIFYCEEKILSLMP